jgi:hypothetical protein
MCIRDRLPALMLTTPEGSQRAEVGDWVVKAQDGTAYTLKPSAFNARFKPTTGD